MPPLPLEKLSDTADIGERSDKEMELAAGAVLRIGGSEAGG